MSRKTKESLRLISYIMFPAVGVLFMLFYIQRAGADVIYSDYIRIVAEYLPDVDNLEKLLTPDILTRIPATFFARFINVESFGYSVVFDRVLGVAGLGIMAIVLVRFIYLHEIGFLAQTAVFLVLFSLIKWEILLNGTAWAHLVSFGLFFINYLMADKLWRGETSPMEEFFLLLFPLGLLLFAGEYIASYAVTMVILSIFGSLMGGLSNFNIKQIQRIFRRILIFTIISLLIYMFSRSFAVWEHTGATDQSFWEVLNQDPLYLVVFFFKTFTGAFLGRETIENFFGSGLPLNEYVVIFLGILIFLGYLLAFYLYFRSELFEESVFPMILLMSGFINHLLVTFSRWIFLDTNYALSSRYSSQFMIGIIGMFLIFAMYRKHIWPLRRMSRKLRKSLGILSVALMVLIIAGNCYTTYQEIEKARFREENFTLMYEMVANYRDYSAKELKSALEWTKDESTMYQAFEILEENRLNVFSDR